MCVLCVRMGRTACCIGDHELVTAVRVTQHCPRPVIQIFDEHGEARGDAQHRIEQSRVVKEPAVLIGA